MQLRKQSSGRTYWPHRRRQESARSHSVLARVSSVDYFFESGVADDFLTIKLFKNLHDLLRRAQTKSPGVLFFLPSCGGRLRLVT
ncbi:MAG: hypothetical protein ACR2HX_03565 [Pyrinomonadaceae bacterium]